MSDDMLADFIDVSASLTGFPAGRLRGTGQGPRYLAAFVDVVGAETVQALLDAHRAVAGEAGGDAAALARGIRRTILSDGRLGPLARNLIKLWYTGTWYELSREWREAHGASAKDVSFVVSPESYTEGLLWPAVGANPSGAKPLGYGMWANPPRIETS